MAMDMRKDKSQDKYQDLLRVIESSDDPQKRGQAIYGLVSRGGADGARVLLEVFPLLMWRETKFQIIDALSSVDDFRVTEFLINITRNDYDLPLAREACFALGKSPSLTGHVYLLNIVKDTSHFLYREALFALSGSFLHSDFNDLPVLLETSTSEVLSAQMPCIMSALGASGNSSRYKFIEPYLSIDTYKQNPELLFTAIIAAGKVGGDQALEVFGELQSIHDLVLRDLIEIAGERIKFRQSLNRDEILESFLKLPQPSLNEGLLSTLREINSKDMWDSFLKRKSLQSINPNTEALIRIALYSEDHYDQDCTFVMNMMDQLDIPHLTTLVRLHSTRNSSFIKKIYDKITGNKLQQFSYLVFYQDTFNSYLNILQDDQQYSRHIDIINSFVSWYHIDALSPTNLKTMRKELFAVAKKTQRESTKERCIRALGQINYNDKDFIKYLSDALGSTKINNNSYYLTLKQLATTEATSVLSKQIARILNEENAEEEIRNILWYLSQTSPGCIGDTHFLSQLKLEQVHDNAESVLKILTNASCPNFNEFVEHYLSSADYNNKLLAIAASKYNMTQSIAEILGEFAISSDFVISERSLDSLSKCHKKFAHQILLELMMDKNFDKRRRLKILRAIEPESKKHYRDLSARVTGFLKEEDDDEITDALINLKSRFDLCQQEIHEKQVLVKETSRPIDHDIDNDLVSIFPTYSTFPETTQSALRNTEIVFKYSNIFHDRVDKSTILVEYVKAIDILLHTHLGPVLFYENSKNRLTQMQSRIYLLGFDNPRQLPRNPARILQCEEYFPQNKFPMFKLSQISQDILTGRITNQQFQTVDGLRAWALILLLFFRHLEVNYRSVEPILKLQGIAPKSIPMISAKMNELQSLRNDAAHRGLVLEISDLINIRQKSFALIRDVVDLCQKVLVSEAKTLAKAV